MHQSKIQAKELLEADLLYLIDLCLVTDAQFAENNVAKVGGADFVQRKEKPYKDL